MENVLIIDVETTGLTPKTDVVIEIGAVLYSVSHAAIIEVHSMILDATDNDSNPITQNAAEHINRIPARLLRDGYAPELAWPFIEQVGRQAQAVLAHNAEFDRSFVPAEVLANKPWICTYGIRWPRETAPAMSLVNLALAHGLGVVDAHRAINDCLLIARLLTRCAEMGPGTIDSLLAQGLRPQAMFQALVSFDDKDKAKAAGFRWDGPTKKWLRKMAIADTHDLDFDTVQVQS